MASVEKIKVNKSNSRQANRLTALLAVAVPVIIMLGIVLIYGTHYDTNDDATLANLSAGAYGTGLHSVHLNIILSAIMRPLYMLAGDTNWYVITQLLLSALGIAAIYYSLMKKLGRGYGLAVATAILIPFAGNFFTAFQYSKTSMLMLTGGLVLITENLEKFNKLTLMGIILSVFGSMTRWESFFAAGGLFAAILLARFFSFDQKGKINAIITMLVFFTVIIGAEATDVIIYNSDRGWKEYVAYNAARTEYSDYNVYLLKGENIFREDGLNDCEFALLDYWDFYDEGRFTTEFLNSLNRKVPGKSIKQTILDTAYTFKTLLYGQSYRYAFLLTLIVAILAIRKKPQYLAVVGTVAMFGCLLIFLMYRGRFTRWVETGLLWAVCVVLLFCIADVIPELFTKKSLPVIMLAVMCVISISEYTQLIDVGNHWRKSVIMYNYEYDDISRDKENLFLFSTTALSGLDGYDVWHPRRDDYFSNIVVLGGWLSRTPYRDAVLEKYGIERPMVDCVDKPNVYLGGKTIDIIAEYASQQLGVPVYIVHSGKHPSAPYQLVTQKP